jgi:membrane-associated phospholipid phosphatase
MCGHALEFNSLIVVLSGLSVPWPYVTRLGEALILLPAMAAAAVWLWRGQSRALAIRWAVAVAVAAIVTTGTKVAFLGFGVGVQAASFTGVSGHAMFAAAVLPVLLQLLVGGRRARPALAFTIGVGVAAVIAGSRVALGAHSVSESVAGLLLGLAAAWASWPSQQAPESPAPAVLTAHRSPPALAWMLAIWALAMPAGAPPSPTHGWVVRLSLALSGRDVPYSRATAWPAPITRPAAGSSRSAQRL